MSWPAHCQFSSSTEKHEMHWPEEEVGFPQGGNGNNVSIDSSSIALREGSGLPGRVGKVGWGRGDHGCRHICFSGWIPHAGGSHPPPPPTPSTVACSQALSPRSLLLPLPPKAHVCHVAEVPE